MIDNNTLRKLLLFTPLDKFKIFTKDLNIDKFTEIKNILNIDIENNFNIDYWRLKTTQEWITENPISEKQIINFYKKLFYYIPELSLWSNTNIGYYKTYIEWLQKYSWKTVLDYGGGIGDISIILKQLNFNPTHLDINGVLCKYVKQRFKHRNLDINTITISKPIKQLDKQYDCIICLDVLEHIVNPLELLKIFTKHLTSKGGLILKWTFTNHQNDDGVYTPLHLEKHIQEKTNKQLLTFLNEHYILTDKTWNCFDRLWIKK